MIVLKELAELVQACKDIKERQTHKSWVHVDDIAATLQKIIDDEFARANRTFDQANVEEAEHWDDWGKELAQLRANHIKNANNKGNA
tara:strand:- start:681 stop:941 length:261 start_codon:yes stop_codon:yes gene_type:complete